MVQVLRRILAGQGTTEDLDTLLDTCDNINGRAFCALGDGATSPITSSLQYFRSEYEDYIAGRIPPRLRQADLVGAH
jgi:NADH-quinone oxidoreductase subunit F